MRICGHAHAHAHTHTRTHAHTHTLDLTADAGKGAEAPKTRKRRRINNTHAVVRMAEEQKYNDLVDGLMRKHCWMSVDRAADASTHVQSPPYSTPFVSFILTNI